MEGAVIARSRYEPALGSIGVSSHGRSLGVRWSAQKLASRTGLEVGAKWMRKSWSVLLGALVLALVVIVMWRAGSGTHRHARAQGASGAGSADVFPTPLVSSTAFGIANALAASLEDATFDGLHGGAPGMRLADGSIPPRLPASAPGRMRFGVILVQYRGAQRAPSSARSKPEALHFALSLAHLAQRDFEAAVAQGDPGSVLDAGVIAQAVLEPAPNYVLFTLPDGAVGGPVDTPTGYWIVKNLRR